MSDPDVIASREYSGEEPAEEDNFPHESSTGEEAQFDHQFDHQVHSPPQQVPSNTM